MSPRSVRLAGFTLIEVMVALVIVALGMSALLEVLTVSAGNISALRDKTVAEWVAMNEIADVRLALNPPPIGTTEGDIADCAHGTWHWRQDVSAVSAIPGLINITVSVRRTGNSVSKPSSTSTAQRGLAAPSSLGASGSLGSVQSVGASGCIASAAPGGSLGGSPTLGAPGTLGAPSSLNSSAQLGSRSAGPGSLGASGALGNLGANQSGSSSATAAAGSALSSSNAAGTLNGSSSNGSSTNSSSSLTGNWLVTLTGFRGNAIGAASGESPNWVGTAFTGVGSTTNQNGGNISGNGANGGIGSSPTLGPQTPLGSGGTGNPSPTAPR